MRNYFIYGSGYINIDNDTLYLTNYGNWQETHKLHERKKEKKCLKQQKLFIWCAYIAFIGISIWLRSYLILILVTAALGINNLFGKTDTFKISLTKIVKLERSGNNILLYFNNEADELVSIKLKKVTKKDYQILKEVINSD